MDRQRGENQSTREKGCEGRYGKISFLENGHEKGKWGKGHYPQNRMPRDEKKKLH